MLRRTLVAAALASLAGDAQCAPQCTAVPPSARQDCGHPAITKDGCLNNKDCCYGPHGGGCSATVPCCFWGAGFRSNYTAGAAGVSSAVAPPARPTWPGTFFVHFEEFFAGGDGQSSEGAYALDVGHLDKATGIRGAEFVARGGITGDLSCHAVNPGAACATIAVAGQRYLSFDDVVPGTDKSCCRCCSWANGCGPLMPKWVENATYASTKIVRGEPCYSYSVPGTNGSSSLSVRVSDGMICDVDSANRDFFEFIPTSYQASVPDAVPFEVPPDCETWCGARGACALG